VFTAGERAAACHWRNYCRVEVCDHSAADAISYTQVGDEKHRKYCKYCGFTEVVAHAYTDNKCECGKVYNEATDTWTVTIYKATDINSTAYDAGTVYHVIKGKSFPVPAPDAIEGLTFMQWKQNPASAPENIEMKDADFDINATVALEITPTADVNLYAQYRYAYNEEWTWSANHLSATVTLKQGNVVVKSDILATVTTEEQEATASENGYKKYTATAQWDKSEGITYQFTDWYETPYVTELTIQDNADNDDLLWENHGAQVHEVELSGRTLFKDGKWNTLCLPFALSAEQIAAHADFSGATLMELNTEGKNGFDTTSGTLWLTFKSATAIAAGVPYLVKWDAAGTDFTSPVFSGVTIDATASTTVSDADEGLQEVQMVGTYSPVSVTADDKSILFLGDANKLYYSTIDRQIRSCRAYFSVPYIKNNAGAKARAFALSFDGEETTGIKLIDNLTIYDLPFDADGWYSLDGRKLSGKPSQRGMYINKGKKILVK
jgi:hypothetical protein